MSKQSSAQNRALKVTYEMIKNASDTSVSRMNLEAFEKDSNADPHNQSNTDIFEAGRQVHARFENRLWETSSSNSNFSFQILQSNQPCSNCLKMTAVYLRTHLRVILFIFLILVTIVLVAASLALSPKNLPEPDQEKTIEKVLQTLNVSDSETNTSNACSHQLCRVKANSLFSSLNIFVNPCDNFSKFACDNYHAYLPETPNDSLASDDWTPLTRLAKWATVQLRRMLEDTNDIRKLNVSAISKAADFYEICKRNFELQSNVNMNLKQNFKQFFTTLVDWPLTQPPNSNNSRLSKWSLEKAMSGLILNGVNPFLEVGIVYSKELKSNIISLGEGALRYRGTRKQMRDMYRFNQSTYVKELEKAVLLLGGDSGDLEWAKEMWLLEKELFEISYNSSYDSPVHENEAIISIDKLQRMYGDEFDFKVLFSIIFGKNYSSSENILLKNVHYFYNLPTVLAQTSERSQANLVGWLFLLKIAEFLPREFSSYLPRVAADITEATESCLQATINVFPASTGTLYAFKKAISEEDAAQKIGEVFKDVVEALVSFVEDQKELKSRDEMVRRLRALELEIVRKENSIDSNALNKKYQSVVLMSSAIENYLVLKFKLSVSLFSELDKNLDLNKISPLDSTVVFNERTSKIQVPLALLQSPLYQSIYPRFLIYSSLGSILSHHVAHSLLELDELLVKECLEKQHKQRSALEIENGERFVVMELLADSIGLRSAYHAYKRWHKVKGSSESDLPNKSFSMEQLFFINYAQTWCRNKQPDDWMELGRNYDFHQPSRHRVNNALRNMPEFSKAFNCPPQPSCPL